MPKKATPKTEALYLRLSEEQKANLRALATKSRMTMTRYIVWLIEQQKARL